MYRNCITQDPVKIQGQVERLKKWQGQGHGQNMECELQRWEWVVMDIGLGNKVSGIKLDKLWWIAHDVFKWGEYYLFSQILLVPYQFGVQNLRSHK